MTNGELIDRQTRDRSQSDKAFGKLVSAFRPLVEQKLKDKYGGKWESKIARGEKYLPNLNDPLCLLWTLHNNWIIFVSSFRHREGDLPEGKNLVLELKEYRNIAFHSDPKFTTQEKDKAIDNVFKLLDRVVPRTPAIEEAISCISELKKENLLKEIQELDNSILPTGPKSDEVDTVDRQKKLEAGVSDIDVTPPPPPPPLPVGDLRVDRVQSANGVWWLLQIYDGDTLIGSYERSHTESEAKEKEIEILWPNNPDKRNIAAAELRKAYAKNGEKPFIVRWVGSAIGQDGKKGVKQIKDEDTGELLGEFPKCCFRK